MVNVAEDSLTQWFPVAAEDGGFDFLWPSHTTLSEFSDDVTDLLALKGWCLIRTMFPEKLRSSAAAEASKLPGFEVPPC